MKKFFTHYKNEITVFSALCINLLKIILTDRFLSDTLYPLSLVNLKAGFISRTLIGSFIDMLWKHPTKGNVIFFHICAILISYALISFYIGKCIKRADEKTGIRILILSVIMAVFPLGFGSFISFFGLLDIYWLLTAVLIIICGDYKKLWFFIPVLIFSGLWVHYSFLLAFMPLAYIAVINIAIKEKSRKSYILLTFTVIISVSFTFYFMLTARKLAIPFEEFQKMIIETAGTKITQFEAYIGKTFQDADIINERYQLFDPSYKNPILATIIGNFKFSFSKYTPVAYFFNIISALPLFVFFESLFTFSYKKLRDKKQKFLMLLCIIFPIITVLSVLLSTDTERWVSLMLISQFLLVIMFINQKDYYIEEAIDRDIVKIKEHKIIFIFALCLYLCIFYIW